MNRQDVRHAIQKRGSRKSNLTLKMAGPVVTRAAEKETHNRIIGLICPFLPPRVFVKYPSIRKMLGRGGGDRSGIPSLLSLIDGRHYQPKLKPIVRNVRKRIAPTVRNAAKLFLREEALTRWCRQWNLAERLPVRFVWLAAA